MSRFVALPILALAFGACRERHSVPATPSAAPSASNAVGAETGSASSVASPSAPSASAPAKPVIAIRCKALDKGKLIAIGAHGGEAHELVASNGFVYTITKQSGRVSVVQLSRDGAKPKELGHVMQNREPESLHVDDQAAYFTAGSSLYSVPFAGGEVKRLAENFSRPIALADDAIYGVRSGSEPKIDELVTLPRAGGAARVVASFPRSSAAKSDYRYLSLDADRTYASDWASRRILSIALGDGKLDELAVKRPFPERIALEADSVTFQSAAGIFRVKKSGGDVVQVSDYGSTPFETIAWDDRAFYVLHTLAYAPSDTLVRISLAGGKPTQLEGFAVADVTEGGGRVDVAVDDECVYIAHNGDSWAEVLARPKPR